MKFKTEQPQRSKTTYAVICFPFRPFRSSFGNIHVLVECYCVWWQVRRTSSCVCVYVFAALANTGISTVAVVAVVVWYWRCFVSKLPHSCTSCKMRLEIFLTIHEIKINFVNSCAAGNKKSILFSFLSTKRNRNKSNVSLKLSCHRVRCGIYEVFIRLFVANNMVANLWTAKKWKNYWTQDSYRTLPCRTVLYRTRVCVCVRIWAVCVYLCASKFNCNNSYVLCESRKKVIEWF